MGVTTSSPPGNNYQELYQDTADKLAVAEARLTELEEASWAVELTGKYEETLNTILINDTSCRTFNEDGDDRTCITQEFPKYMMCAYCLAKEALGENATPGA